VELRALGKAAVLDGDATPPKERLSLSGAREVAESPVSHSRWHMPVLPTLPSLLEEPHKPFIHRDLSWLQFNDRVLDEAGPSSGNPLLERVKFLAISASNLDEFFMIRFASLGRRIRQRARAADGGGAESAARLVQIRDAILETVAKFVARQEEVLDLLVAELAEEHIHLVKECALSEETCLLGRRVFESHVLPRLSAPETFDPVKLLQLENLKIAVCFPNGLCFRVSRTLPSVLPARSEDGRLFFFFLDDLLLTHLGPCFGIAGVPGAVRLTRDADFTVDIGDGDPSSIPDRVRQGIGDRERGVPVRLQYVGRIVPEQLESARTTLKLVAGQILPGPGTLGLHGLWSLVRFRAPEMLVENPKLRYPAHAALVPKEFDGEDLFASLRARDYLLHHPYDSFDAYLRVLERASEDPAVEEIALTIYRVDRGSPIIESLKNAAARGKRVRAIVELRARFDESRNLEVADELRRAGVYVSFGFGRLKLHAKVTLISRRENGELRRYTHLSTGNYNAATARLYTDMAILTGNAEIGQDAATFFEAASQGKIPHTFKRLVSAPTGLHRRLLSHIGAEIEAAKRGLPTGIFAKVNALVDEQVIGELYRASQAGVRVDLVVRGACSLIPQVKGLSDNIRVISIVDRFLEHSRIYWFRSQSAMYLSSADWMPRNFFSRLELAFPVLDPAIYAYIERVVVPTYMDDTVKARELSPQGVWKRRAPSAARLSKGRVRSQFVFARLAENGYDGTPLLR
jgi:polyphosphate kinase